MLKLDVKVILSGMVLKHVDVNKQKRLMEMIEMGKIENELDDLVYEQYGDKLDAKDKELETKDNQIKNLKKSNSEY